MSEERADECGTERHLGELRGDASMHGQLAFKPLRRIP